MDQHDAGKPWFRLRGPAGAGNALEGARRARGLTQAQLAVRIGVDRTTVLTMEAGRSSVVARFLKAFDWLGYDLIAVPKDATVRVETSRADPEGDET
jgi:transcriptional regulator with XRE-family HTH domain